MKKEKFNIKTVKCVKCGKEYEEAVTKEMEKDFIKCAFLGTALIT